MDSNLRLKLSQLSDLLERAWEDASVPATLTGGNGETGEVVARYAGKRWPDVKFEDLSSGYASLNLMDDVAEAYYMMSFFYHGIRLILIEERGSSPFNWGLELVETAGRACASIALNGHAERLLSERQREAVYRALCGLSGLVPELIRYRLLWFYHVRKGQRLGDTP